MRRILLLPLFIVGCGKAPPSPPVAGPSRLTGYDVPFTEAPGLTTFKDGFRGLEIGLPEGWRANTDAGVYTAIHRANPSLQGIVLRHGAYGDLDVVDYRSQTTGNRFLPSLRLDIREETNASLDAAAQRIAARNPSLKPQSLVAFPGGTAASFVGTIPNQSMAMAPINCEDRMWIFATPDRTYIVHVLALPEQTGVFQDALRMLGSLRFRRAGDVRQLVSPPMPEVDPGVSAGPLDSGASNGVGRGNPSREFAPPISGMPSPPSDGGTAPTDASGVSGSPAPASSEVGSP